MSKLNMEEKVSSLLMSMLLLLPFSSIVSSQTPLPPQQPWCHDDERSALLELKGSFGSDSSCFESWKIDREARNCCSWRGVTCGGPSSHVVGLDLASCRLRGSIPPSISNLTQLITLDLGVNDLNGSIPSEIGRLVHLQELDLNGCYFEGPVPPSVSNLTALMALRLSHNSFQGPNLPFISNLTRLEELDLGYNQFTGDIPPSITSLIRLTHLYLYSNKFTGEIPYQIASLTHLQVLALSFNRLRGRIPTSLSQLRNLSRLLLESNNLDGIVQLDLFSGMERLEELVLSFNNFSLSIGSIERNSLSKVRHLGLAQCNLMEFPAFLENLDNLVALDLSQSNLSGEIPEWLLSVRLQTLSYLNLSGNYLTGFPRDLSYYNSSRLKSMDLRFNRLRGSLPLLSRLPSIYLVSSNMLSGEIPQQICDNEGITFLDLSKNNFTGELPQCLFKTKNLKILAVHSNNLHGRIPKFGGSSSSSCELEMIDLSDNQLQGPLPRSLSNCSTLKLLNVGNNRINDTFPSWLGSLSELRVLILRSNYFHGGMKEPKSGPAFPKLQIIDISLNNFQGSLPSLYFQYWRYMGESGHEKIDYLTSYQIPPWFVIHLYDFSMTIINKGVEMEYSKILGYFKVLDLSSNNFTGVIPDSISSLRGLHRLNISNNMLTGSIPPSLGALVQLEALDLSSNELSGEIPQQLTELNFLSILNVSYNNLSGHIPQGAQFGSFPSSSYWGNPGLCGDPLSRKRGSSGLLPPPSEKDGGSDVPFEVEWKAVAVGYAVTFVIGAVIGHRVIGEHANWFARTFGLRQLRRRS